MILYLSIKKGDDIIKIYDWNDMYILLKNYYSFYGNSNIPEGFKTKNGYTYDEHGVNLYDWKIKQANYIKLKSEKKDMLSELGIDFNNDNDKNWNDMYELAKNYFFFYGNLNVPSNFTTLNGYEISTNGLKLGKWISRQRNNRITTRKQYNDLCCIAMRWNKKENDFNLSKLCEKYSIPIKENENILYKIPWYELQAKIRYLLDINQKILLNGKLNCIFQISNLQLEEVYGISYEELILNYYIDFGLVNENNKLLTKKR